MLSPHALAAIRVSLPLEERELIIDALTIATGHWARKGDEQPQWSDERAKAYGISNEFADLRDKYTNH